METSENAAKMQVYCALHAIVLTRSVFTFNSQLSKRLLQASIMDCGHTKPLPLALHSEQAPRAKGCCTFNSQFSIRNLTHSPPPCAFFTLRVHMAPKKSPSIHTINLGCSKNQVDAERIVGELLTAGYQISPTAKKSDYILVNTCGFIESAKEESIEMILAQIQGKTAKQKVIVAGCLSKRYAGDLAAELPEVDFWTGTYQPGQILDLLGRKEAAALCRAAPPPRLNLGGYPHHAYLKVAEGCNRNCAFCAIPGIRGKQDSRSIASLIDEAKQLEQSGVKEITLIAQDLSFYGRERAGKGENLEKLLEGILHNTSIPWVRMLYLYPAFITDGLLGLMAKEERICNYADMPIQHASDRMLKLMRRNYTGKELRDLLYKMRERVPGLALRSTVLLGFPGETHEDYEELMRLVEDIRFDRLGGFVWSPEEGTHAMDLKEERVPEEVGRQRLEALIEAQNEISLARNEALIGQEVEIIIDEVAEESEFHFYARTRADALEVDNQVRILEGDGQVGEIRKARIVDAGPHELDAVLVP